MNRRNLIILGLIVVLTALTLTAVLIKEYHIPGIGDRGRENTTLGMSLGLDLSGGTHLVYQADLSQIGNESAEDAVQGIIDIISRRVDAYGVSEPLIQKQGADRISIQLPGIRDMETAVELIGQIAQLDFRELVYDSEGNPVVDEDGNYQWKPATGIDSEGNEVHLTGRYLKRQNQVVLDPTTNEPQVAFEFNSEGAKLFEQITTRLLEKPLGIFLDDQLISSPTVKAVLSDSGVITGLSLDEARNLAILLNAGALPVPLKGPIVREDIDPTLGADSLRKSLIAGMVGIILVILFMVLYYRLPGALASVALVIYGILVLAAFKLIPVTLTLSGIAAFILSIGMAVDANVLIFERLKEELRGGRPLSGAIEAGFNRAWSAIRDSNFTTLIVCAILYWMGSMLAEPRVMGFALTLAIGVALSMFTAIVVTRTFLRILIGTGIANRPWLFGVQKVAQTSPPKEKQ